MASSSWASFCKNTLFLRDRFVLWSPPSVRLPCALRPFAVLAPAIVVPSLPVSQPTSFLRRPCVAIVAVGSRSRRRRRTAGVVMVKQAIIPRVHGLALKTTVAAVRVNALLCLGELIHTLDKPAALEVLRTLQRCTAVDRSQPTLMCTLAVAKSLLKQYGTEFSAEHVLPILAPLLIAQQLNVQQFAKYMAFVKDVLRSIEEKRGVSGTDSGLPEVKSSSAAVQLGPSKEMNGTGSVSAVKKIPSWDFV